MHLASTAVSNTVPVGGAVALGVQARMFSSWGLSAPNMAAGMLVVGLGDNAPKILAALVGAVAAAVDGELPLWVKTVLAVSVAVAVLGGGLLVVGLRTDSAARVPVTASASRKATPAGRRG
jgi:hypothetical protein